MRLILSGLILSALLATNALAGTIEDNFKRAVEEAEAGNGTASAAAMREAAADLWLETPLGFSEALFVTGDTLLFGAFDPRDSNVFKAGDVVFVYAEPIGYGWRKEGDFFVTELVVDAALLAPEGDVLWEQKEFGKFDLASRRRFMEYMLNLELNISGLPAGKYVLEYSLTDNVLGNQAKITLPLIGE